MIPTMPVLIVRLLIDPGYVVVAIAWVERESAVCVCVDVDAIVYVVFELNIPVVPSMVPGNVNVVVLDCVFDVALVESDVLVDVEMLVDAPDETLNVSVDPPPQLAVMTYISSQSAQALQALDDEIVEADVDIDVDGIAARYHVLVDVLLDIEVELGNVIAVVLVLYDLEVIVDQLVDVDRP
jgi:hypothetical protein